MLGLLSLGQMAQFRFRGFRLKGGSGATVCSFARGRFGRCERQAVRLCLSGMPRKTRRALPRGLQTGKLTGPKWLTKSVRFLAHGQNEKREAVRASA